jgi:hypothetical protein
VSRTIVDRPAGTPGPHYRVALREGPRTVWLCRVQVNPREKLSSAEIQRRARRLAVAAFGRQARGWPLVHATRHTR